MSAKYVTIFLDLDGVLLLGNGIDRGCYNNLKILLDSVEHHIVLSSSRRFAKGVCENIQKVLGEWWVVEALPDINTSNKSYLISEYFRYNRESKYIILDDKASLYSGEDLNHLILCNKYKGFDDDKLREALDLIARLE